jgi:hypothetical protein
MVTRKKTNWQKKIKEEWGNFDAQMSYMSRSGDLNRARSVTVGTAFGGSIELSMRRHDGKTTWAVLQPVEVIELIHQLSAQVGCHLNLKPRNDFGSWRNWRVSDEERLHLQGHPPFSNDLAPHMQIGANMPAPEEQPGLKSNLLTSNSLEQQLQQLIKDTKNEQSADKEPVATKETVRRKRTKRSTNSS